ncbi:MAG TPA: hypothetical protein VMS76_06145, partial [Planctomycetota bacterium]|nr:hypothetical protein [Planctomycetota bacterium]
MTPTSSVDRLTFMPGHSKRIFFRRGRLVWLSIAAGLMALLAGCGDSSEEKPKKDPVPASKNDFLTPADIEYFHPGRSKSDVLRDVQWRGNFQSATTYESQSVYTMTFMVAPEEEPDAVAEERLLAVFIDDEFSKFVEMQYAREDELVERYNPAYQQHMKYLKPMNMADCRFLIRAVESPAVDMIEWAKNVMKEPPARKHIDWGLTAVFVVLKPALDAKWAREGRINLALRDQFNAARLSIGMTEQEVESVFGAKPLESGKAGASIYKIYGSNESFDLRAPLHFANVLVLFDEGKVNVIHGVPAGYEWRRTLGERFL